MGVRDWTTMALKQSIDNPNYGCAGAGPSVISLAWDALPVTSPSTVVRVLYVVSDVGGEHQLRRVECQAPDGVASGPVVKPDVVLVHNLSLTGSPPTRACLNPTLCTGTSVPQRVSLTMTIRDPANTTDIVLVLNGQRGQT